jgi:anti-sigma factor RsiW
MPPSASLKYLVQDLIDGRLSADEAARVEQLIRDDPELAHTARFYRWLNDQLPKLFETDGKTLPPRLQRLLDELASLDDAADDASDVAPAPGGAALSGKPR